MRKASTGGAASICKFTGAGWSLSFQFGQRTGSSSRAIAAAMSYLAVGAGRSRSRERAMVVSSIITKRTPKCSREMRVVSQSTVGGTGSAGHAGEVGVESEATVTNRQ